MKRLANRHASLLHVLMAADKHLNYDTAQLVDSNTMVE